MATLLFGGDLAWSSVHPPVGWSAWTGGVPVVVNLEGPVTRGFEPDHPHTSGKAFATLRDGGLLAVTTANNHYRDSPDLARSSSSSLASWQVPRASSGCGPTTLEVKGRTIRLVAAGWPANGCPSVNRADNGPALDGTIIDYCRRERRRHPDALLVLSLHWNYELETYPQPWDRALSRALCGVGVDLIVGHHPHVVGGHESFHGRHVFYSLGNFLFESERFYGGTLRFPSTVSKQVLVGVDVESRAPVQVRHATMLGGCVSMSEVTGVAESPALVSATPFRGCSDDEYLRWFKEHRQKRAGLPVFSHRDGRLQRTAKMRAVAVRQPLVQVARRLVPKATQDSGRDGA